jgi:glycosyltransferase involved in cell wall biosynthesis
VFPKAEVIFLAYFITIVFSMWGAYHVLLSITGVKSPLTPVVDLHNTPKVSIIIPARNEPLLGRTIEACLLHTDYPDDRKEIVVVTDDPIGERIALWYQQEYPQNVKVLARRQFFPTKPSALNDALPLCTGDLVAVMDVEDIPDRDILLKAASAITQYGYQAVQAILRISNPDDSWITKIFSMEYAGWFRVWLNARYRLGVYAPLGGTGNYFSRSVLGLVGGWDPTNLAEDAEVGISLWKYAGYLTTPTAERRLGLIQLLTVVLMLMAPFIVVMNWLAYGLSAYWLLEYTHVLSTGYFSGAFPVWALIPLTFNVLYYYVWIEGSAIEGIGTKRQLAKYIPHMFFYCNAMMPIAALRALYQEVFAAVQWEKTAHPGRGVKWATAEKVELPNAA